jgi:hypothetical protein
MQYTDTNPDSIGDYDFGSNTTANTNQYKQYRLADGARRRARGEAGLESTGQSRGTLNIEL